METKNLLEEELQLTDAAKGFLKETAKWAYLLAIIGFVGIGLIIIVALFAGTILSGFFSAMPGGMGSSMGIMITVVYLLLAALYFFPVFYLYKFASKAKIAFREEDTQGLTDSLEYLKSHYKFLGVMMLIMLGMYALILVIGVLAALFR